MKVPSKMNFQFHNGKEWNFHVVFSILRRDSYTQNLGPEFEIVVKKPNSKHMSKLFKIPDVEDRSQIALNSQLLLGAFAFAPCIIHHC